jgi:hypothetical protein
MPCCLIIKGSDFPVDEYMEETKLADIDLWHKNDPTLRGPRLDKSGLGIQVSNVDLFDLEGQIREVSLYLIENDIELKKLVGFRGVEEAYLSFAIEQADEIALFSYFPSDFVTLAGEIGLGIHVCQFRCCDSPRSHKAAGPD